MMSAIKEYRVWILCEDRNHYHFTRGFLCQIGINERRIMLAADLPEGKGSGEQFVREQLPIALQKYARHKEKKFLVIMLDVDKAERTPEQILGVLQSVVEGSNLQGIKVTDKLLFVFPKRNIETWFKWLDSDSFIKLSINEIDDYKQTQHNAKPTALGKKAGGLCLNYKPDDESTMLPSMQYTCSSLKKLVELL